MTEVLVRDEAGATVASLGGVLESLTVTAGGGGGGGGAVDWWLLAFLAGLPALQRRRAYAARYQSLS
jgi:hypothetical protein